MAAAKAKCLSLYILLMLITFFSSCQIQARDIKSFSKVSPRQVILSQNDNKYSVSLNSATAEPQPTATPRAATTGHGYGLYGNENNKHDNFHPTTTDPAAMTTTPAGVTTMEEEDWANGADDDQELIGNANPDFEEFENMAETHQDSINRHNNNAYYSKNNRNYNNRPAYDNHGYNNNNGHDEYNNNGNSNYYYYSNDKHRPTQQQGMSDTRYLANGKYFYDLESETNNINNGAKVYDQDDNAEQNYNNKANEYQTSTNPGNYNKMNHDNNYWRMSDQKQQGMSDTRFLNNGNYYYHGDNNKNNHQRGAGYMVNGNNDGYNIELTQGRPGVSYGSSHDEEDQQEVAGGFNGNNNNNNNDDSKNYKRRYVFDSVEEYEKEEEQRLARKYGYHAP